MLKDLIISIQSFLLAHRFIIRHRLWKWILIPGILYAILFATGFFYFWKSGSEAVEWMMIQSGLQHWLESIQDNWMNFLVIMGNMILFLILLLFYFSLFKYFFLIVGSPLLAYLSEKTEAIMQEKEYPFSFRQLLSDMIRGIKLAFRNMLWQSVYLLSILILSFIPLIGWVAPLFTLLIECYYLGFSMLDYSCERNKLSNSESLRFIGLHKGLAIGNGVVFYLMHLIPVAGWILAPSYSVVAATISFNKVNQASQQEQK
jgi:CysZ protein